MPTPSRVGLVFLASAGISLAVGSWVDARLFWLLPTGTLFLAYACSALVVLELRNRTTWTVLVCALALGVCGFFPPLALGIYKELGETWDPNPMASRGYEGSWRLEARDPRVPAAWERIEIHAFEPAQETRFARTVWIESATRASQWELLDARHGLARPFGGQELWGPLFVNLEEEPGWSAGPCELALVASIWKRPLEADRLCFILRRPGERPREETGFCYVRTED